MLDHVPLFCPGVHIAQTLQCVEFSKMLLVTSDEDYVYIIYNSCYV